jgi:DNA polymerase
MTTLYLDTETFSPLDIAVGTYRYAENADILLITYAIDDGPVFCWDHSTGEPPPDVAAYVRATGCTVVAHNAMFDRNVLRLGNLRQEVPVESWRCTMVQALSHAFPGSLDELGRVLGLPAEAQKLQEGRALIQRFCKPAPKNHKADRYDRNSHPQEWARFVEYAKQDITAMREIHRRLPDWNWQAEDIAHWHLDQRINDQGFCVDHELTSAGARAAIEEKTHIAVRFAQLTGGLAPTQRAAVARLLNDRYDLGLDGTAKHIMEPLAADETMPAEVREIATLVLSANKTSTAKYAALEQASSADGRFRGGLQFAGASRTRRFAGRVFQPQNLPSRGLPKYPMVDAYISALKAGCHREMFDDLMLYGAAALRGVVVAPPGKKLVVADLSNIEGRILAYLAGEEWKLQAFRDYDAGKGPDLYNITATGIVGGDPYQVPKTVRNVFGKVPDLALGYEGGGGALQTFAKAYRVAMSDHWDTIEQNVDPRIVGKAETNHIEWGYAKAGELGIDKAEWIASEVVKLAWRARHPATRALWYACKDAALAAIRQPGTPYQAGPRMWAQVVFHTSGRWLLFSLPSGRYLTYYDPAITDSEGISYMGMGSEDGAGGSRAWSRQYTYGGKIVENACQALAGDVLKYSMPTIEANGYETVLTVHDEIIAEVPDTPDYSADILAACMSTPPTWATALPLAAAGFETYRYKKED